MRKDKVAADYRALQQKICSILEQADGGSKFMTDHWTKEIGEGFTMVFEDGHAIEKAAVNFSAVNGPVSESMRKALNIDEGQEYFASGISSIIHPRNPHAPITHMNVRYFELSSGVAWFGGGIDLTPHYVDKKEATWFHRELKTVCDRFDADYYPNFKKWADDYFYLKHRAETRGVGGIFFDHKPAASDSDFEQLFAYTKDLALAYPRIYVQLLNANRDKAFTESEKKWQYLRRGRYVEFNLLYDRGTKFGLESNGRTESIFLSMPPMASWTYDYKPEAGSREEETLNLLKKDIDWISF
ncbi:oxygen-dependent coproporphyrinogen oxidase [Mangrovibacterium diazotrophicum]|uniref:coproporphyrinogen oxidase n=1 Tax=Mangrovibacterium diazotrophicum TaxID=1261403 RepID=A0A419W431_9BACT|nr:oxygen-dependent coproporphyrinogen oxidase [Mangrovibacterium diazotrophicum]RKD90206.1 coproporphyrinogen oxidase [Mangrovibacterium diazotrophicum]